MNSVRLHTGDAAVRTPFDDVSLDRAALRIADADESASRFQQKNTRTALLVIVGAIQAITRGEVADLNSFSWTPEAPRLLAALRLELLHASPGHEGVGAELRQYLLAIEQLSASLERDAAARFTHSFSGADALKLLVEVAHDMASPLSAILFLVERLQHGQSGPVTSAQERHLALVYSAAFGLSTMSSDMMELARGGARLTDEAPKIFSVSEVLRSVRDLVQPLAEEKRLSVRFSGPPIDKRFGQPGALSRVLLNLTTNAFKFTTVGSVTVLVEQDADPDVLTFVVEDSGRGIPEAELADIFSVFTQRENTQRVAFSSAGMGLAICQKLVSAMGGTLTVTSEVNRGTRFTFALRLAAS